MPSSPNGPESGSSTHRRADAEVVTLVLPTRGANKGKTATADARCIAVHGSDHKLGGNDGVHGAPALLEHAGAGFRGDGEFTRDGAFHRDIVELRLEIRGLEDSLGDSRGEADVGGEAGGATAAAPYLPAKQAALHRYQLRPIDIIFHLRSVSLPPMTTPIPSADLAFAEQACRPCVVKERMLAGRLTFSLGIQTCFNSEMALMAERSGYDALLMNLEHGKMSLESCSAVSCACLNVGSVPFRLQKTPAGY